METIGVLHCATGSCHLAQACLSAQSLKKYARGIPTCLFTDSPGMRDIKTHHDAFDQTVCIRKLATVTLPFLDRLLCLAKTPFDRTLALDADTLVLDDITPMFSVLDRFDIAMCHAHEPEARQTQYRKAGQLDPDIPTAFCIPNGGVILYRRCRETLLFLEHVTAEYVNRAYRCDQPTIRRMLWRSAIRFYVLPREYNFNDLQHLRQWKLGRRRVAKPKIFHYTRHKNEPLAQILQSEGFPID